MLSLSCGNELTPPPVKAFAAAIAQRASILLIKSLRRVDHRSDPYAICDRLRVGIVIGISS
jgi:hypothetical protein